MFAELFLPILLQGALQPSEACAPFDSFVKEARAQASREARQTFVDAYAACIKKEGLPLIEPLPGKGHYKTVFVFQGDTPSVFLAGDMNGWNQTSDPMERIEQTNFHYRVYTFPEGARLDYKFIAGKEWVLDPLNPRTMKGGFGPNSHFWLPGYTAPEGLEAGLDIPRGTIKKHAFKSQVPNKRRIVQVYLPPGYDAGSSNLYPVLYMLDGEDYIELGAVNLLADFTIARHGIRPPILVLIPPLERTKEYETRLVSFEKFLIRELVPFIDRTYRTQNAPASRGIMGVSLGGYAALNLAAKYPHYFGRCGAQSTGNGSQERFRSLLERLQNSRGTPAFFYIDVGTFENNLHGADLLAASRAVKSALSKTGARVLYTEVPEGHSWGSWRARIPEALRFFWPLAR